MKVGRAYLTDNIGLKMQYNQQYFKNLLPKRPENSHKGTFGHVLNLAGCENYTGAAYFSSISTLKVGCGRVTLASNEKVLGSIASLSPDIILMPSNKLNKKNIINFQAVSIGCGLSTSNKAVNLFKSIIKILHEIDIPIVIDADGLNILSSCHCETFSIDLGKKSTPKQSRSCLQLAKNIILTPHPAEMSRLMGVNTEEILSKPEFWAKKCCEKYNCTTVLKIHETIVADNGGNFYANNTGNSALAHGGSGDVLCGMITGFLAQGLNSFESSILGVYLHGLTAEIASKELTEYSVLASDLLKYIPESIKTIL